MCLEFWTCFNGRSLMSPGQFNSPQPPANVCVTFVTQHHSSFFWFSYPVKCHFPAHSWSKWLTWNKFTSSPRGDHVTQIWSIRRMLSQALVVVMWPMRVNRAEWDFCWKLPERDNHSFLLYLNLKGYCLFAGRACLMME